MLEIGTYKFKSDTDYFQYVFDKYFRKIPPIPTNIYLNLSSALDVENRIRLASLCHFPSVINTLARDENYSVQEAAQRNEFWILVGQLQDVLGFEKRERREFARQEVFRVIIVLLMFEDDIDVLREVLRNASISTQMLTTYIEFLEKRGRGKKDQQIQKEARNILAEKKQRIIKAAEVHKAAKNVKTSENRHLLLSKLADDDQVIRKAVHNYLLDFHVDLLFRFIKLSIHSPDQNGSLSHFMILSELVTLVRRREDLRRMTVKELKEAAGYAEEYGELKLDQFLLNLLNNNRLELLDKCQEDLTDFQNILLLTHCHCDPDPKILGLAANIVSLDDIFALAADVSTPQHIFKSILDVLSDHPEDAVRKRVNNMHLNESERLRNRLRELEQSITAYFDIIFNSLGFPKINEYNIAIKAIEQAERTISKLAPRLDSDITSKIESSSNMYTDIKKAVEAKIFQVNSDTTPSRLKDMLHVADMIQHISDLRDFGKEGLRPGGASDLDPELISRATTIWQSALGPFLGRIKHLNEMVKTKFSILASEIEDSSTIRSDLLEVIDTFEHDHKTTIDCKLTIACADCTKRSCAAERFLTETKFFIEEMVDNFVPEPPDK